jgi:hypothetical protein
VNLDPLTSGITQTQILLIFTEPSIAPCFEE